jgi:hypothetical protein
MSRAVRSRTVFIRLVLPAALLALGGSFACRRERGPIATPQEFVRRYAAAYRAKDVDAICSMWADLRELEERAGLNRSFREAVDRRAVELQRAALEHGLATDRLLYRSWGEARYVSHEEYDDHIRVTVETMGTRAELVLVRQDGTLRVHPQPNWFE